jgi:hypothetical protein
LRQIDKAVREDKPALLALAGNPIFSDLSDSANVMAQSLLALRSVGADVEVIGLFNRLPSLLQRMSFFREELAYALHQLGESNAAALKLEALVEEAPNSSSYALLGRVYKDLWTAARSRAQSEADSLLRQAIQAYLENLTGETPTLASMPSLSWDYRRGLILGRGVYSQCCGTPLSRALKMLQSIGITQRYSNSQCFLTTTRTRVRDWLRRWAAPEPNGN